MHSPRMSRWIWIPTNSWNCSSGALKSLRASRKIHQAQASPAGLLLQREWRSWPRVLRWATVSTNKPGGWVTLAPSRTNGLPPSFLSSPFPSILSTPKVFLDKNSTLLVTSLVIVSHRFTQSVPCEGPAPLSHYYDENRAPACPEKRNVTPLNATLVDHLTSVANKRLTENLNPLDATLTKKQGGRVHGCW
jgi:hypothetical protein